LSPRYVARRLIVSALMLIALSAIVFLLAHSIPSDPAFFLVRPQHSSAAQIATARHKLGVDKPLIVQYGKFLWNAIHGDLGNSWSIQTYEAKTNHVGYAHVGAMVIRAGAVTGSVVLGGALLLLALAVPLGALSAMHPRSLLDRLVIAFAVLGIATHPIVIGSLLQRYFAGVGHPLPAYGYCSLLGGGGGCGGPFDWATHLVLAWISFALLFVAIYVRVFRARMLEVLAEPYITVARAKGSSETRVVAHHALRNAAAPMLTMIGMEAGIAVGVVVYLERVYGLPGLGSLTLQAFSGDVGYDLPLILGITLFVGAAIILINLVVDLLYAVVDPTLSRREGIAAPAVA